MATYMCDARPYPKTCDALGCFEFVMSLTCSYHKAKAFYVCSRHKISGSHSRYGQFIHKKYFEYTRLRNRHTRSTEIINIILLNEDLAVYAVDFNKEITYQFMHYNGYVFQEVGNSYRRNINLNGKLAKEVYQHTHRSRWPLWSTFNIYYPSILPTDIRNIIYLYL